MNRFLESFVMSKFAGNSSGSGENKLAALISGETVELSKADLGTGTMKNYAFYEKPNIVSVELPENTLAIPQNAFGYCTGLKSIPLDNIVVVYEHGFYNCTSLEDIGSTSELKDIRQQAFQKCTSLKEIILPSVEDYIQSNAFSYCTALSNVVIGASATKICNFAFAYCTAIETFKLLGETPPVLESSGYVFKDSTIQKIIVPKGALETYKTATNWSAYADVMEEATE